MFTMENVVVAYFRNGGFHRLRDRFVAAFVVSVFHAGRARSQTHSTTRAPFERTAVRQRPSKFRALP